MKKKASFITILLALLFSQTAWGEVFTVNSLNDAPDINGGHGICETTDGECTLRAAIQTANINPGSDIILFSDGLSGTIELSSSLPTITQSLEFIGPNPEEMIIDANSTGVVLRFNGNPDGQIFKLEKLTITGGSTTTDGGGIQSYADDVLTIDNCIIEANNTTKSGGGISTMSATLNISNSEIRNNTAGSSAGGIRISGGLLHIDRTTFSGNKSPDGYGGAIGIYTGSVDIWSSLFTVNEASSCGAITFTSGTLHINNSTFTQNSSTVTGGAICSTTTAEQGTMTLNNVTIAENTTDSTGGGIWKLDTSVIKIRNSIIANNHASSSPDCHSSVGSTPFDIEYSLIKDPTDCPIVGGNNVIGEDPLLNTLADNGGNTLTFSLKAGSPAINLSDPSLGCRDFNDDLLTVDQRGAPRPIDTVNNKANCDSGAFEASCGDGAVQAGVEECDNGSENSDTETNACRTNCKNPSCGDAVTDTDETCDEGVANSDEPNAPCRSNCGLPTCGDGIVDDGESCDDGSENSDLNPDSCRTTCAAASCGDGVVDAGEACDDGNANNSDACLNTCVAASCGDGVVQTGVEECDGGDKCTPECKIKTEEATVTETIKTPVSEAAPVKSGSGCSLIIN